MTLWSLSFLHLLFYFTVARMNQQLMDTFGSLHEMNWKPLNAFQKICNDVTTPLPNWVPIVILVRTLNRKAKVGKTWTQNHLSPYNDLIRLGLRHIGEAATAHMIPVLWLNMIQFPDTVIHIKSSMNAKFTTFLKIRLGLWIKSDMEMSGCKPEL